MIKNILKHKNKIILASGLLNILFIIFIILTLLLSSFKNREGVVNMDGLGKLQQAEALNTTNLKHSQGIMQQIMTLNKEIKKIINQNKLNIVGIAGLENALKKYKDGKESFENKDSNVKECDNNCSPEQNEYIQIFRDANQNRGKINSMLGWIKISESYDKIYNKLQADISKNKKALTNIVFEMTTIQNKKETTEKKDNTDYSENFDNIERFANKDIAKLDQFIVQNTTLIHSMDVQFSSMLEHMNKIKSLKEAIDGQTLQIKKIHKKLETISDKAIPGSTSYVNKNPNAKASNFVNTAPITGRPT